MSVSFERFEYTDVSDGYADHVEVTLHFPQAPTETHNVTSSGTDHKFVKDFTNTNDVEKLVFQPYAGSQTYGNSVTKSGAYLAAVTGWNAGTSGLPDNQASKLLGGTSEALAEDLLLPQPTADVGIRVPSVPESEPAGPSPDSQG